MDGYFFSWGEAEPKPYSSYAVVANWFVFSDTLIHARLYVQSRKIDICANICTRSPTRVKNIEILREEGRQRVKVR